MARHLTFFTLLALAALGCGDDDGGSGTDAGREDSGMPGMDAGPMPEVDAGPMPEVDAGPMPEVDAGPMPEVDAGPMPEVDAGPPVDGGPVADWAACAVNSECVLEPSGCCPPCGSPELGDMHGVNTSQTEAHFMDVCPVPMPCPRCATFLNPYLIATCNGGRCEPRDTRLEGYASCSVDEECRLRTRECCECGGTTDPYSLIAIRIDMDPAYSSQVCDPLMACPECLPSYPSEARAVCNMGHCEVVVATP